MNLHTSSMRSFRSGPSKRWWWIALLGLLILMAIFGFWIVSQRSDGLVRNGPVFPGIAASIEGSPVDKGAYIFRAAGCAACHTAKGGNMLAGGRPFETPFGTFYSSNITPDPTTGIGGWSDKDLIRALRDGISPDGSHYFPAFPYTSYTLMVDEDIRALKAYLDSIPASANDVPSHELDFPLGLLPVGLVRYGMIGWKWFFFDKGPYRTEPEADQVITRGEYLVQGLGHCGACHTPRNLLGARQADLHLEGTRKGPDGKSVPAIHYHEHDGIGAWQKEDITFALETGMKPDGDVMGGAMAEVVEDSTSHLSLDDLEAMTSYLMTVTPDEQR